MEESAPKLVIVRRNSCSGKTTWRWRCSGCSDTGRPIGKDHFRRVVLREHYVPNGDNIELITNTVRYCLGIGYHVVLEGILFSGHYGAMIRDLVNRHPGRSHVFYLDVPLEETLRRHQERPLRDSVSADMLRAWYVPSDVLGMPDEIVLDGTADENQTLRRMSDHIGPLPLPEGHVSARFI